MKLGHTDAWPTLVEAARSDFLPGEGDEEGWKNHWAGFGPQTYIRMNYKELRKLGLSPTLEEMEERWSQEGGPKYRLSKHLK